jgi:hypothetical protein
VQYCRAGLLEGWGWLAWQTGGFDAITDAFVTFSQNGEPARSRLTPPSMVLFRRRPASPSSACTSIGASRRIRRQTGDIRDPRIGTSHSD